MENKSGLLPSRTEEFITPDYVSLWNDIEGPDDDAWAKAVRAMPLAAVVEKGGKGSGNFGHAGRPGKVGGSSPRGDVVIPAGKTESGQYKLFNPAKFSGGWRDQGLNQVSLLVKGGMDEVEAIKLNKSHVPKDVQIALATGASKATTARRIIAMYDNHKDDEAFYRLMQKGLNVYDLERLEEAVRRTGEGFMPGLHKLGGISGGLTDDLYQELVTMADDFSMSMTDATHWTYFMDGGYGLSDIANEYIPPYMGIGLTDPEIIETLAYEEIDPELVKYMIANGTDVDDLDSFKVGLSADQADAISRALHDRPGALYPEEIEAIREVSGWNGVVDGDTLVSYVKEGVLLGNTDLQSIYGASETFHGGVQAMANLESEFGYSPRDVKSLFEYEDDSGISARSERIAGSGYGVKVIGKIYDEDGYPVGDFTRTFDPYSGTVSHDYLAIQESEGSKGFGYDYYRNLEEKYLEEGINRVTIHANIDVGGYAWARMGYDFIGDHHSYELRREFAANVAMELHPEADGEALDAYVDEVANSVPHSWDIAAYTMPDGRRIGKEYMLGQEWHAEKEMDPESEGWKVGQTYYNAKDEQYGK